MSSKDEGVVRQNEPDTGAHATKSLKQGTLSANAPQPVTYIHMGETETDPALRQSLSLFLLGDVREFSPNPVMSCMI